MKTPEDFNNKVKHLLEHYPNLFPTEASFWAWLRGGLRRGLWEKSSLKLSFKNSNVSPPPKGYTGRGKKGQYCALTGEWIPTSKLEVDHKDGNKPLRSGEDVLEFILHMLADHEELQLVSKDAHKVKSYAERMGISFEEARATKQAIAIQKDLDDKQWLRENGIEPASNAKARREQIVEKLRER